MSTPDPEALGRAAAEALVADIEKLKAALTGPEADPDRAVAAGEVAVEAMKRLLSQAASPLLERE